MSYMKQVPREDFEILTKYHPGEIRYYVDTSNTVKKNKGARVKVKRNPKKKIVRKTSHSNRGRFVQLAVPNGQGNMMQGTKQYLVYSTVTRILENDPTKVLSRKELTDKTCAALPAHSKQSVIVPSISALLKLNRLRYTGDQATV